MNKLCTVYTLAALLIATNTHIIKSSPNNNNGFWKVIVEIFYGPTPTAAPQPQEEAPAGLTVDDYLIQLRFDLNGTCYPNHTPLIPWQDVFAIEDVAKTELQRVDLRKKDYVNQIMGSIMKNHVESQAKQEARKYTTDINLINSTSRAIGNSFATRLEQTPNRNGHALHQFFGTPLAEMVRSAINNPTYNHYR